MNADEINKLSNEIIGAALEVHYILGPGLLEHAYQRALALELESRGHKVRQEVEIPIIYKGVAIESMYRIDLIVDDEVIIELKATEKYNPLFTKQLYTYLKFSDKRLGLLINFNCVKLAEGIKRVVNKL